MLSGTGRVIAAGTPGGFCCTMTINRWGERRQGTSIIDVLQHQNDNDRAKSRVELRVLDVVDHGLAGNPLAQFVEHPLAEIRTDQTVTIEQARRQKLERLPGSRACHQDARPFWHVRFGEQLSHDRGVCLRLSNRGHVLFVIVGFDLVNPDLAQGHSISIRKCSLSWVTAASNGATSA